MAMDTPRLLAINDVQLAAPPGTAPAVTWFYTELIGFQHAAEASDEHTAVFRGYPRTGPQLAVDFSGDRTASNVRRQALIMVASLVDCAELLAEQDYPFLWSRGWTFYDRRLRVTDPAGNDIELVTSHPL